MRTKGLLLMLGAVLAIAAASATAAPAVDKDQVIKDRQAAMKEQGRQWVIIRNYLQDKATQAEASAAAEALVKSVPKVPDLFPPASDGPAPGGKWGPKPEIWSEHDKFLAADRKVAGQVAALDAAIKAGDKAKVEVAFKELDLCSGCHKTFRAKLQ